MNRYKYIDEKKQHLHTLDGKPLIGTSSVVSVMAKNLTWWAAETSAIECLETGEKIPTIREEYLAACASPDKKKAIDALQIKYPIFKKARFAHFDDKNKKAKKGTNRHELLEVYVKKCIADNDGIPLNDYAFDSDDPILNFKAWVIENIKKFLWSELHCYNENLWTGGIADVGWEDKQGRIIAGDFKSSKEAYFDQVVQVAGYDLEITHSGGLTPDGDKIFDLPNPIQGYCIVPFGGETLMPELFWDIENYKEGFKSALSLHKLSTNFKN